jgi:HSP20 family protein
MGYVQQKVRFAEPGDLRAFQRMLEQFHMSRHGLSGRGVEMWLPPTDVYETEEDIVVKMSLPGVAPENIAIRISGDTVTICGRRENRAGDRIVSYHQMEIHYGFFERHIIIHRPFDGEGAAATYSDGFLVLRIPKAAKPFDRVLALRITF